MLLTLTLALALALALVLALVQALVLALMKRMDTRKGVGWRCALSSHHHGAKHCKKASKQQACSTTNTWAERRG